MAEWDCILKRKEYAPEKPDEIVVNLVPILHRKGARRILDLGCGAGRHILYLMEKEFEVYGIDISETGLKTTEKRLEKKQLDAKLMKGDMKVLPFIDSCFDSVICINTIYHQRKAEIEKMVSEVFRILKKNCLFLANFHSKRSSRYGKGIKVEEDTFMDETGPEKGVLHCFVNEEELRKLLSNFRAIKLKTEEERVDNYLRSRITVLAEK